MGGIPDDEITKALQEALENMKKDHEPTNANFMQVVPDSHRFTLYGLKLEVESLLKFSTENEMPPIIKNGLNYILIGLKNSQREDIEMI